MAGIGVDPTTRARVRAAMSANSRENFLPPDVRHLADADHPVMIGWNATNSQPSTVARMLALLDVQPGDRVLDVGSGSGWTTAILSTLAGEEGTVIGVELVPQLVSYGRERLAETRARAEIREAIPGVLGLPEEAPFDRILVSAQATSIPVRLEAQLAEGGCMVVPVAGLMTVVDMRDGVAHRREDAGIYSFVPLEDGEGD
ncbi:protein-L-isoaspartate O-methyltransferase [Microbacterium sp. AK031]|uniref:protein-L-isoaspartate O-methyltransferase family protein n=1 Tax=Microbacterium sp. AK031 TaxID=2723076 RepID=UPI00216A2990|nr:protein-L-isoaspartate O-methyltransferase [Microbacterium sp. AK031]MCS3844395.1 protein-L-isoaspartate(D-aspartate) O-methyltransferase [Microbacterium sp. AK031]